MGFLPAIKSGFRNYATFSGRASRPQFWWWVLFVMLGAILCTALDSIFFGTNPETGEVSRVLAAAGVQLLLSREWSSELTAGRRGAGAAPKRFVSC